MLFRHLILCLTAAKTSLFLLHTLSAFLFRLTRKRYSTPIKIIKKLTIDKFDVQLTACM